MNVSLGVILICAGAAMLLSNVVPGWVWGAVMCVAGLILLATKGK